MMRVFWYTLRVSYILAVIGVGQVLGQTHSLKNNIVVRDAQGADMVYAWAGGSNMAQYSDIDLDLDGKKDMVIFNREGRTFTTFLNVADSGQIAYRFAPQYMANFQNCDCVEWALLEDYNCDGREDVICGRGSGHNFRVYENVLAGPDSISFELRHDPLFSEEGTFLNNLYQTRTDIPALVDVDYDGDLDFITSQSGSSNTWAWHRNYGMEEYGRCDTLLIRLESRCWGHFAESFFTDTLVTPDTINCPIIRGGGIGRIPDEGGANRHVGGAMLVFDSNGDSLMDALIGDVSYPTAILAINGGTLEDALMIDAMYEYPAYDSSINMNIFPAFYFEDVNLDGKRDLIVSPNSPAASENIDATALYINEGRDDSVDFRFMGRDFLVDKMVDVGLESAPLFFDYDQDGLIDLLVAGDLPAITLPDTLDARNVSLRLYRNVGDLDTAAFQLVDADYLGLNSIFPPISRPVPALADLDGDGDQDLFIGLSSGKILHYINMASPGGVANFIPAPTPILADALGDDIDPGSSTAPEFFDLDGDNDLDLMVGHRFGYLAYYENQGSSSSFSFAEVTQFFGDIRPQNDPFSTTSIYSRPRFIDYDQDGDTELLVGEVSGNVEIYENPIQGLTDSLIRDAFLFDYDFGRLSTVTAAVIDSTGDLTWVIGNELGGLYMLNTLPSDTSKIITSITDDSTSVGGNGDQNDGDTTQTTFTDQLPAQQAFRVYPNPTEGGLTLSWLREFPLSEGYEIRVFNAVGQSIYATRDDAKTLNMDLSDQGPGIYILQVKLRDDVWTERVWVR